MTTKNEVSRTLADHESRLVRLESVFGKSSSIPKISQAGNRITLPQHILNLRDTGFFSLPRTADEVHKQLIPTYHSEPDRIAMALLRLASKKSIRKSTKQVNGRRYQAYVW